MSIAYKPVKGRQDSNEKHSFSKTAADKIDDTAALVLKYLGHRMRKAGQVIGGKQWVRVTQEQIADQYAYIKLGSVDGILARLKKAGAIEVGNFTKETGRPKFDQAKWYHVPKAWEEMAETELRYFWTFEAERLGISAAVVLYNFDFWANECERQGKEILVKLSTAALSELLPYSKATIKRAVSLLVKRKRVEPVSNYYTRPVLESGSNTGESGSNTGESGSKAGESGSKAGDDKIDRVNNRLEKDSKTPLLTQTAFAISPFVTMTPACQAPANKAETNKVAKLSDDQDARLPEIGNRDTLLAECGRVSEILKHPDFTTNKANTLVDLANSLLGAFVSNLGASLINDLFTNGDEEATFSKINPLFRKWFGEQSTNDENAFFNVLYYGILECVVGAINKQPNKHPISLFRRISYPLFLTINTRIEETNRHQVKKELAERKQQFLSIDAHKEEDTDAPAAEKARTFMQGVNELNKVGWLVLGEGLVTGKINVTSKSKKQAEHLFKSFPYLSPAYVLDVLKRAVALQEHMPTPPAFKHGIKWHARNAHRLTVFTGSFQAVLNDLKLEVLEAA